MKVRPGVEPVWRYIRTMDSVIAKFSMVLGWGVQQDDVTWKNESNLEIRYEGRVNVCEDTSTIHVTCVRRPDRR